MGTLVHKFWQATSKWSFSRVRSDQEFYVDPLSLADTVPARFKDSGEGYGPTAQEIEAKEHQLAEDFRREQMLPIMGMAGCPN